MVARRTFLVLGFVGVLAGGGWVYAQQRSASRPANLSAQDYVDIQMLYARYNQGSDFSDTAMWMSIWADDAFFKIKPPLAPAENFRDRRFPFERAVDRVPYRAVREVNLTVAAA